MISMHCSNDMIASGTDPAMVLHVSPSGNIMAVNMSAGPHPFISLALVILGPFDPWNGVVCHQGLDC